jgi:hypothetical protein
VQTHAVLVIGLYELLGDITDPVYIYHNIIIVGITDPVATFGFPAHKD